MNKGRIIISICHCL